MSLFRRLTKENGKHDTSSNGNIEGGYPARPSEELYENSRLDDKTYHERPNHNTHNLINKNASPGMEGDSTAASKVINTNIDESLTNELPDQNMPRNTAISKGNNDNEIVANADHTSNNDFSELVVDKNSNQTVNNKSTPVKDASPKLLIQAEPEQKVLQNNGQSTSSTAVTTKEKPKLRKTEIGLLVVKLLTPAYVDKRFESRDIFKSMARKISHFLANKGKFS